MNKKKEKNPMYLFFIAIALVIVAFLVVNISNQSDEPTEVKDGIIEYNDQYELIQLDIIYDENSDIITTEAEYYNKNNVNTKIKNVTLSYDENLKDNEYIFIHEKARYENNELIKDYWIFKTSRSDKINEYLKLNNTNDFVKSNDGTLKYKFFTTFYEREEGNDPTKYGNFYEVTDDQYGFRLIT